MSNAEMVSRQEDMSPRGKLELTIEKDGDVIVTVYPDPTNDGGLDPAASPASVQFCTSGGQSPRTLHALRSLFEAMVADNLDSFRLHSYSGSAIRL